MTDRQTDNRPPQKGHDGQKTVMEKTSGKQRGEQGLYLGRQGQSCIPDESRSEATHGGGTHACCD